MIGLLAPAIPLYSGTSGELSKHNVRARDLLSSSFAYLDYPARKSSLHAHENPSAAE